MAKKCRFGFFINPENGYPRMTDNTLITSYQLNNYSGGILNGKYTSSEITAVTTLDTHGASNYFWKENQESNWVEEGDENTNYLIGGNGDSAGYNWNPSRINLLAHASDDGLPVGAVNPQPQVYQSTGSSFYGAEGSGKRTIIGVDLNKISDGFYANFWMSFARNTVVDRNTYSIKDVVKFKLNDKYYSVHIDITDNELRILNHTDKLILSSSPFQPTNNTYNWHNFDLRISSTCKIECFYKNAYVSCQLSNLSFEQMQELYTFPGAVHAASHLMSTNWSVNDGSGNEDNGPAKPFIAVPYHYHKKIDNMSNFELASYPGAKAWATWGGAYEYRARNVGAEGNKYRCQVKVNTANTEDFEWLIVDQDGQVFITLHCKNHPNTYTRAEIREFYNNTPGNPYTMIPYDDDNWAYPAEAAGISTWGWGSLSGGIDAGIDPALSMKTIKSKIESETGEINLSLSSLDKMYWGHADTSIVMSDFNNVEAFNVIVNGLKTEVLTSAKINAVLFDDDSNSSVSEDFTFVGLSDVSNLFSIYKPQVTKSKFNSGLAKLRLNLHRGDPLLIYDADGDGIEDSQDPSFMDADGDGVVDELDALPNDPNESVDSDGDGVGDNSDSQPNNPGVSTPPAHFVYGDDGSNGIGYYYPVYLTTNGLGPYHSHVINGQTVYMEDANANHAQASLSGSYTILPGTTVPDADGDGVPDDLDAFPNDASLSAKQNYSLTWNQSSGSLNTSAGTHALVATNESNSEPIVWNITSGSGAYVGVDGNGNPALILTGNGSVSVSPSIAGTSEYNELAAGVVVKDFHILDNTTDTDGDGVADFYDSYPNASSVLDSDGDGLTDEEEASIGSDPNNTDSDGDGLDDYEEEMGWGIDPNNPDTDGDGIGDYEEATGGNSDPGDSDTDGDGVQDGVDAFPSDPDETADTDGDGVGDNADGAPNDPSSTTAAVFDESSITSPDFAALTGSRAGWDYEIVDQAGATLTWDAVPGATEYSVTLNRYSYSDQAGNSTMIDSVVYDKDNGYVSYGDSNNSTYSFTLPTETESTGYIIRVNPIGSSFAQVRLDVVFVLSAPVSATPAQYQQAESLLQGNQTEPLIVALEIVQSENFFGSPTNGVQAKLLDTRNFTDVSFKINFGDTGGSNAAITGWVSAEGEASADGDVNPLSGNTVNQFTKEGSLYTFTLPLSGNHSGVKGFSARAFENGVTVGDETSRSDFAPELNIDSIGNSWEISEYHPNEVRITSYYSPYSWNFASNTQNASVLYGTLNGSSGYGHYYGNHFNIALSVETEFKFVNQTSTNFYVYRPNGNHLFSVEAGGETLITLNQVRDYNGSESDGYAWSRDSNIMSGSTGTEGFIYVG